MDCVCVRQAAKRRMAFPPKQRSFKGGPPFTEESSNSPHHVAGSVNTSGIETSDKESHSLALRVQGLDAFRNLNATLM